MPLPILLLTTLSLAAEPPPFISDELGLTLTLPPNAEMVRRAGDGGMSTFLFRDGGKTPMWSLRIDSTPTRATGTDACLREVLESRVHPDHLPETLDPVHLNLAGRQAAVLWLPVPASEDREALLGWMVAPQALDRCLVVSAVTIPEAPPELLATLDGVFASVQLLDLTAGSTALAQDFTSGEQVLNLLTEERLRSLVGSSTTVRIRNPTASDHGELGYGTIQVTEAPKSDLQTGSGSASDSDETGLLVTTHLRLVEDADTQTYIDRVQRCWVSWDLTEETWIDSATRRQGDHRSSTSEVGVREPPSTSLPRGQLLVVREDGTHGIRSSDTLVPESPWLPRALRWHVWDAIEPAAHPRAAWNTWDDTTASPRVTIRRDRWQGPLVCWSWAGLDGLPTELGYASDGRWQRAHRPGGTVIEHSDRDTINTAWGKAGLRLR
ncbi:MAG: hypothetical protein QF561_02880 [Phycisphaerales bacterium]|jgi:hypothetical protein|nr:hypothetical protein [Phycisphaerales bacterium]